MGIRVRRSQGSKWLGVRRKLWIRRNRWGTRKKHRVRRIWGVETRVCMSKLGRGRGMEELRQG